MAKSNEQRKATTMPTGYTHNVQDGTITEFRDFAMQCARAFGALVLMRDDPMNAEIPDKFDPTNYHVEALREAQKELDLLDSMSPEQMAVSAYEAHQADLKAYNDRLIKSRLHRQRYEDMVSKVEAWAPPTDDHVEMKKFMLTQLKKSIDFDCRDSDNPPKKLKADWHAAAVKQAKWSVAYHKDEHEKEVDRAANRTAWVIALKQSLQPAE
jgi:hypothetical protein